LNGSPKLIQFISLHAFDRMAEGLLDDEDIRLIQQTLMDTPHTGAVVQRAGGLRKLRIAVPGRGKRGGARLLYLYVQIRGVIYFVAVFDKATQANLTIADYRVLAALVKQLKKER
jgi:hypothetical protein